MGKNGIQLLRGIMEGDENPDPKGSSISSDESGVEEHYTR